MATISSTTGHNPRGERKVAGILYIAIAVAVVVGLVVFFMASRHQELDPYKADRVESTAPDAVPGTGGGPAAVAVPEADRPANMAPQEQGTANPSNKNQ